MSKIAQIASVLALLLVLCHTSAEGKGRRLRFTQTATANQNSVVMINGSTFDPKVLKVKRGTTVEWINNSNRHSVDADDGSFNSEVLKQGEKFQHTFDRSGTYPYYCRFHGAKGGKEMAGKIVVSK